MRKPQAGLHLFCLTPSLHVWWKCFWMIRIPVHRSKKNPSESAPWSSGSAQDASISSSCFTDGALLSRTNQHNSASSKAKYLYELGWLISLLKLVIMNSCQESLKTMNKIRFWKGKVLQCPLCTPSGKKEQLFKGKSSNRQIQRNPRVLHVCNAGISSVRLLLT
jgi:hypothetical protein